MKKTLSITLFFIFSISIFSQKTISGNVKNDEGKPIASASVTIEEIGKNAILNYAITDAKGSYKVTFSSNDAKILVKVKAFNHETILENHNNETQVLNFTLNEKATEIKEVKLKTKLITKKGDTISYDLKSFESKADRTLADVLKKIPGIEVNKDGSILYQGEPINKFYVNGKDLMEGSYGVINNSLPKDAVQKVEVMENHQPIKILQDKLLSENAAINIKLKKTITMTGRGEVSSGFGEPWLWNLKLTPMLFTQKYQWVLNYKTNNVGEEVEKENNILAFGNRFEGMRRNFSENSWLSVERASIPQNTPIKRYLFNNVHYFSANVLTNLTKDWEFKANTSYTNNAVERESVTKSFDADTENLATITSFANNFYTNQAKGELIFSKNANKSFFKNTTTYNALWNTDVVSATDNNDQSYQRMKSPSHNFQNSLSAIIPWKEKLVNVMSFISYRDDKQDLYINPGSYIKIKSISDIIQSDLVHQFLDLKTLEVNHSASVGFTKKSFTFTPEIGLNITRNKLLTDVNGETGNTVQNFGEAFENDIKFNDITPYTQLMVNYKKSNLEANITFPVNFNNISVTGTQNFEKKINTVTYEPRLFARYDITSFWKISTFAGISNSFGNVNDVYNNAILFSARSLMTKATDIQQTKSNYIGSRLEYRNPLNNIFFNVSYNYFNRNNNIIYQYALNNNTDQTELKGYNLENTGNTNSVRTEIGKYFPKLKTNFSVGYNYSLNKVQQLLPKPFIDSNYTPTKNDLTNFEGTTQSVTIKLNNNKFSWLSIDYNATYNFNKNLSFGTIVNTEGFNHALSAFLYPIKKHTIGFTWDYLQNKTADKFAKNAFYDLSYQYSLEKQKIDLELKLMNITNNNIYENISYNSALNRTYYSTINIRPRQLLLTVKFNFK